MADYVVVNNGETREHFRAACRKVAGARQFEGTVEQRQHLREFAKCVMCPGSAVERLDLLSFIPGLPPQLGSLFVCRVGAWSRQLLVTLRATY